MSASSTTSSSSRTCPSCGASNSGLSLFCAECGASLNGGDAPTSSFSPYAPESDSQATAAFTPGASNANDDRDSTRISRPVESTVQPYAPAWEKDDIAEPAAPSWSSQEVVTYTSPPPQRGLRGFFLGLLATILIAVVLGAWLWAGVLSVGTRDSIRDFFSFLPFG